jgi:heme a synthase
MSVTKKEIATSAPGRLLHRCAVLLICIVWPLIWVGGLVTTYDAGMAVPDWPGTYGYNMFLYPIDTWLYGPFDLLIEHGHRLLGSLAGLVAIATLVTAIFCEPRRWVIWMAAGVLLAVIGQGMLGGLRVVQAARTLAMIHGCFGPAFFAMCAALAVVTSRWWWSQNTPKASATSSDGDVVRKALPIKPSTMWLSACLALTCYCQLLLGAQLRHLHPDASPVAFRHLVETHVALALAAWVLSGIIAVRLWRCGDLALSRPARWLVGLVLIQICLGVGTWLVNYGVPVSSERWLWASNYVITAKGYIESIIVTAHVATGSLLIALSVSLALRVGRMARLRASSPAWHLATKMEQGIA